MVEVCQVFVSVKTHFSERERMLAELSFRIKSEEKDLN